MKKIVLLYLIFTIGNAESCKVDSDCDDYYNCESGSCERKELFPMENLEIIGTILIVIVSALSNSSGIGGGGLNILICILFFKFEPSNSVPLSQVIILGGSLTTIIIQIPSRHPVKDRPLIDYDLISFVISPMLLGASIGVILNESFPSWLILALLTLLLGFMLYNSIKKYIKLSEKEAELRNKEKEIENTNLIENNEQSNTEN
ncbi:unnamed protein product [Blepharisma stoltei]|uniref:Membrane transporter protein n=1 Tax=Blepharisma stoltei TaxID=1481888 RepID=A0AAU9IES8_9CILI|nr:unnamed protein product [Blepharisma stoltei]